MNWYKNMSPKTRNIIMLILIFAVATVFYLVRGGGPSITPVTGEESLTLTVTEKKETVYSFEVQYKDIDTIQIVELEDKGECISGEVGKSISYGTFKNAKYGEYQLCGLTKINTYMEIKTKDGKYFLSNFESKNTTTEFNRALNEFLAQKK